MALNLHNIVRNAITFNHPDETVTLYQAQGQQNVKGIVTPIYNEPQTMQAQVQGASAADLQLVNNIAQNKYVLCFYLYANETLPPAGIVRPFCRTGDMIKRKDGTWWLVTAIPDMFADVGWAKVLATLQELAPVGISDG